MANGDQHLHPAAGDGATHGEVVPAGEVALPAPAPRHHHQVEAVGLGHNLRKGRQHGALERIALHPNIEVGDSEAIPRPAQLLAEVGVAVRADARHQSDAHGQQGKRPIQRHPRKPLCCKRAQDLVALQRNLAERGRGVELLDREFAPSLLGVVGDLRANADGETIGQFEVGVAEGSNDALRIGAPDHRRHPRDLCAAAVLLHDLKVDGRTRLCREPKPRNAPHPHRIGHGFREGLAQVAGELAHRPAAGGRRDRHGIVDGG